jgi:hypothetical protein
VTNSRNVFDNQHVSIDTIKELSRTTPAAGKPQVCAQLQIVAQVSEWNQFLSSGPEDCEPSVDREGFEKGGVGVEVESVYVLPLGPEDCEPSVDRENFEKGGVGVEVESVYVLSLGPEDCELLVDPEVFGRGGVEVESVYVLSLGPEDCELLVDPEVFGRGGVEVESEYDLELRIGGNLGRLGMRHSSLLTVQMVRW